MIKYLSDLFVYLQTQQRNNRLLKFAWENLNPDYSLKKDDCLEKALLIAERTQILVIIGYSFPGFNREIDKKIFNKMLGLKKIYIQSPNAESIEKIIQSDLIIEGRPQVVYDDLGYWDQFHIPSEWSKTPEVPFAIIS